MKIKNLFKEYCTCIGDMVRIILGDFDDDFDDDFD